MNYITTLIFALAILHTFFPKPFHVEIVFAFWALILLITYSIVESPSASLSYLKTCDFSEAIFVFVTLSICSTQFVLNIADKLILNIARLLPIKRSIAYYATILIIGPLLGSFITEPAAMTISALLLLEHFYQQNISTQLKYATLGLLFVNVSIGGTLTPHAAPPILMVAKTWGWNFSHMFFNFGYKAILACLTSTIIITILNKKELSRITIGDAPRQNQNTPWSAGIQNGLFVGCFLAGLVILGGMQAWWIELLIAKLSAFSLYLGAIGLTAFTDNAALTYLGTLAPSLTDSYKYALVAGAVVGGGLTVIANAPNPAAYNILQKSFGDDGISPTGLARAALLPTLIAALYFWVL